MFPVKMIRYFFFFVERVGGGGKRGRREGRGKQEWRRAENALYFPPHRYNLGSNSYPSLTWVKFWLAFLLFQRFPLPPQHFSVWRIGFRWRTGDREDVRKTVFLLSKSKN